MRFSEILGNKSFKKQLIGSVKNNRLAHSQMFLGENSSPKLLFALAYAQYINCQSKTSEDSCGNCSSIKHQNLTHPDLHLIFPVLSINKLKKVVSDNFVTEWRGGFKNPYLDLDVWFDVFSNENKTGKQGTYTPKNPTIFEENYH